MIGEVINLSVVNYIEYMMLFDLMIVVGGFIEFVDGNNVKLVCVVDGK